MIEIPEKNKKWMFICKKWLISDQKDGKVYAYLSTQQSSGSDPIKKDQDGKIPIFVLTYSMHFDFAHELLPNRTIFMEKNSQQISVREKIDRHTVHV
jgi:hypothetical protein